MLHPTSTVRRSFCESIMAVRTAEQSRTECQTGRKGWLKEGSNATYNTHLGILSPISRRTLLPRWRTTYLPTRSVSQLPKLSGHLRKVRSIPAGPNPAHQPCVSNLQSRMIWYLQSPSLLPFPSTFLSILFIYWSSCHFSQPEGLDLFPFSYPDAPARVR